MRSGNHAFESSKSISEANVNGNLNEKMCTL